MVPRRTCLLSHTSARNGLIIRSTLILLDHGHGQALISLPTFSQPVVATRDLHLSSTALDQQVPSWFVCCNVGRTLLVVLSISLQIGPLYLQVQSLPPHATDLESSKCSLPLTVIFRLVVLSGLYRRCCIGFSVTAIRLHGQSSSPASSSIIITQFTPPQGTHLQKYSSV